MILEGSFWCLLCSLRHVFDGYLIGLPIIRTSIDLSLLTHSLLTILNLSSLCSDK